MAHLKKSNRTTIMQDTLDEHESMRSKGDSPRDFIDAYLDEMEEQSQKNSNSTFSSKPLFYVFPLIRIATFFKVD